MGDTPWFNLTNLLGLQRSLITDLSGSTADNSYRAINALDTSLNALNTAISSSITSIEPTLTHQNEVNRVLEREKTRLDERKRAVDDAEASQKRLVELTNNSAQRNQALNSIYIVWIIGILIYLGIKMLTNFLPEFIINISMVIVISMTLILSIKMYYDYGRRNNMNYNIINLDDPAKMKGDTSASSKVSNNFLNLNFNGCIKDACCSEGTTFNDKFSICVPNLPPNNGNTQPGFKYFIASKSWQDTTTACGAAGYSLTDLACNGNTVAGFTTIHGATSDLAKPNEPTEFTNYNLYK
jgi:hypothetical protein